MKNLLLILLPFMMACPPQDRITSEKNTNRIKKEKVNPTEYEMLTYVDLLTNEGLLVNEKQSDLAGLCQSLFTAHAFNGHIVLSSLDIESDSYQAVKAEIESCHFKYLQLQAADLYDKTYDNLSQKTQGTINDMFKLQMIEAVIE